MLRNYEIYSTESSTKPVLVLEAKNGYAALKDARYMLKHERSCEITKSTDGYWYLDTPFVKYVAIPEQKEKLHGHG